MSNSCARRLSPWIVVFLVIFLAPAACLAVSLRLLVPAYGNPFDPDGDVMWDLLTETALVMGEDLHVILNPNSGPGIGQVDPNYVNDLGQGPLIDLQNAGGFVIGYVRTDWANRSLADVQADVDLYFDPAYWRGAGVQVQCIFFDEMSNDLADVGYYQTLRDYVRGHDPNARVVGNPGTSFVNNPSGQSIFSVTDYAEAADTLMTYELNASDYLNSYQPPIWLGDFPADNFAHVVYAQSSSSQMVSDVSLAIRRKAGYIYVTDDILNNPYDRLPAYWDSQVDAALGLVFADGFESGNSIAWSTQVP